MRSLVFTACALAALVGGCYHYTFEQTPGADRTAHLVTYKVRRYTFFNGLVGNGYVNTERFCAHPVRTELRVKAKDVLISAATLLVYTPHTLYVTCEAPRVAWHPAP